MKRKLFFSCLLFIMATSFIYSPRVITGVIQDDAGKPIIAYIHIKNSQKGVSSAKDGSFSITIADDKAILVVSSIGYEQQEIPVGNENKLTVHLKAVKETLQEVVVVGYNAAMKKDMTAYAPNAGNIIIAGGVATRAGQTLQGRVAGGNVFGNTTTGGAGLTKNKELEQRFFDRQKRFDREGYDHITENPFLTVNENPLSTFSIDVDAASYSNIRRILKSGQLPEEGAVRIEEMINYFSYEYAQPLGKDPFAVHTEFAVCPWNTKHQLVLIGLQGKKIDVTELPPSNLTFLIDVSGSMMTPDRLPLVQASLKLLVDQLRPQDKVSIVVYAGNAGLVLPPTEGDRKITIKEAIDRLVAGGSTAGGYQVMMHWKG